MLISFLFLHENICCGYSLEVPLWGTSNEYLQHMFLWRNKKNIVDTPSYLYLCILIISLTSVRQAFTAYKASQENRDSRFLICSVFFVSKGNLFYIYLTTWQLLLVLCGGIRTSPRTSPQSRLYFVSFGIIGPIAVSLKMDFCSCIC